MRCLLDWEIFLHDIVAALRDSGTHKVHDMLEERKTDDRYLHMVLYHDCDSMGSAAMSEPELSEEFCRINRAKQIN
jgi:hypothetical protein